MASFGFSKMIQPSSSEGDVIAWLKKVDLLANLEVILAVGLLIPLFLEGDALALYLELSDKGKQDVEMIRVWLMRAFSKSPCKVYEKLKKMKWTGKSMDVYTNKIQRLIGLIGFMGTSSDCLAKMAFPTGFPDQI